MTKKSTRLNWLANSLFLKLALPVILVFLFAFSVIPDKPGKVELKGVNNFREKVYLHTDKSYYNAGDDLWFKVYLVDAYSHQSEALSKVVYVNLINSKGEIVVSRIVKINEGCGIGDFTLPENLLNGDYTISAYTNFMRNFGDEWFYRKNIFVNSSWTDKIANQETIKGKPLEEGNYKSSIEPKPDVQFFPEGGYMVDGFLNRVGFKAVGFNGKGIEISGTIVDNSGEKIVDFKTTNLGFGMIKFAPIKDKTYRAQLIYNNTEYSYNLPVALSSGALMQITEQPDAFSILIHSSLPNGIKNFKFIGKQRNKVINGSEFTSDLDGAKFKIPKTIMEQGIVQFTLFDNNNVPLCERLVFVEKEDSTHIVDVASSKTTYGKRELIELEISSDQVKNQNLNANMSVAVTDATGSETEKYGFDIKSYLLLNSELRGEIEQPGYYFYSNDPQRKQVLDLLMMTQGWRQFIINDTLNTNASSPKFTHETGIRFEGEVKRFNSEGKPVKAEVSLVYSNKDEVVSSAVITNDHGHFAFENLDFSDSTSVIIQAKKYKAGKEESISYPNTDYWIVMDSLSRPKTPILKTISQASTESPLANSPSVQSIPKEPEYTFETQKGDILIEEVKVAAKKIDRFAEKRLMYRIPTNHMDFKEVRNRGNYGNVFQALRGRIAGVQILGDMSNPKILIRGHKSFGFSPSDNLQMTAQAVAYANRSTTSLILLDGVPIDISVAVDLPLSQIDFVDVLKDGQAAIFGSQGSKGVIAIYTLSPADVLDQAKESNSQCILKFIHPGYSVARKFYEPVYEPANSDQDKPDNRSTIYWNPTIKLENQDKIKVSFYSADLPTTYKITLEGITSEGGIVKSEKLIDVK